MLNHPSQNTDKRGGRKITIPNVRHIPCNWDRIVIKLETKHVIYQKLATFLQKKDTYVNRIQSIIFVM